MGGKERARLISSEPYPHRGAYFGIKEGVYLVPGVSRAAICDTNTGNVYSVNKSAQEVDDIVKAIDKLPLGESVRKTLTKLIKEGVRQGTIRLPVNVTSE